VLPQLEESYKDLIARYPDAYLARESYWRLILMNLEDYYPPRIEKAEQYYEEFLEKYPGSKMKTILEDAMARFFYKRRLWENLISICSSHVSEYIETGDLRIPMFMFFYSEAKLNLDDLKEAEKGYKIVIRYSPDSTEARLSKKRLDEIKSR
jgi:tetratricopeptide (TPR) repeat protein